MLLKHTHGDMEEEEAEEVEEAEAEEEEDEEERLLLPDRSQHWRLCHLLVWGTCSKPRLLGNGVRYGI